MAWYEDLSPIDYFGAEASAYLRAVGWLAKDHSYPVGATARETYERLQELVKDPFQPCVSFGLHECELCQFEGQHGVANLFVPSDGVLYVAPELIIHYINTHKYLPPAEFVQAVMRCPNTRTMEYKKAFLENGGRALLK